MTFRKDNAREGEAAGRETLDPVPPAASNDDEPLAVAPARKPQPRPSDALAGVLWTTAACAFLTGVGALGRHLIKAGLPPHEVMFLRMAVAMLLLLPVIAYYGRGIMRSSGLHLYGVRCLISTVSMALWFSALALMPLGELTAIGFLAPIFGTMGAALFLGETVRVRRWTATLVGFLGALIILRPGSAAFGPGMWLALVSTAAAGFTGLLVKQLTNHDDPLKVVFLTHLFLTPMALVPALFDWRWPDPSLWPAVMALGAVAVIGHYLLVKAFSVADASLVMMFEYSKLPWAVLFGYLLFAEMTDIWTWAGATVIFASALYTVNREAKVKRVAARPKASPPV